MTTNHFAPRVSTSPLADTPLISVAVLTGVPDFVRGAFGERVFRHACQTAMLDFELIDDGGCFIPQRTMTDFDMAVARSAGEEHLGLKLAPHLTIADYGSWGEYLLGARTLGNAIRRAAATMDFHARGDELTLDLIGGRAPISYVSAARGLDGYPHVAWGTIGVIISLCKSYVPLSWRPQRIDVDLPASRQRALAEDTFECPVVYDAPRLAVRVDREHRAVAGYQRANAAAGTKSGRCRFPYDGQRFARQARRGIAARDRRIGDPDLDDLGLFSTASFCARVPQGDRYRPQRVSAQMRARRSQLRR